MKVIDLNEEDYVSSVALCERSDENGDETESLEETTPETSNTDSDDVPKETDE